MYKLYINYTDLGDILCKVTIWKTFEKRGNEDLPETQTLKKQGPGAFSI